MSAPGAFEQYDGVVYAPGGYGRPHERVVQASLLVVWCVAHLTAWEQVDVPGKLDLVVKWMTAIDERHNGYKHNWAELVELAKAANFRDYPYDRAWFLRTIIEDLRAQLWREIRRGI